MKQRGNALLLGLVAGSLSLPVLAQSHAGHASADTAVPAAQSATPMGMDHGGMPGMDHGAMQHGTMAPMPADGMQAIDGAEMTGMGGMTGMDTNTTPAAGGMGHDAGAMNMQGGTAPPDARDPDAYSDGFTLGRGPYALGPGRRLHMADEHNFGSILVDRLEAVHSGTGRGNAYEAQAWFGNAYNKLVVKSEGEVSQGRVHEARNELLWGRAVSTYFDTQLGIRNDAGSGRPSRNWLAFGVQGLAPYWFEVETTGYVSDNGRTAFRVAAEYELLLTQRLILQPRLEANLYGKSDPRTETGSGLANTTAGIRLRYEFSRQFAPYIGLENFSTHGGTANFVRTAGRRVNETRVVAGVRMWF